jgi:hypothetical protein
MYKESCAAHHKGPNLPSWPGVLRVCSLSVHTCLVPVLSMLQWLLQHMPAK